MNAVYYTETYIICTNIKYFVDIYQYVFFYFFADVIYPIFAAKKWGGGLSLAPAATKNVYFFVFPKGSRKKVLLFSGQSTKRGGGARGCSMSTFNPFFF